MKLFIENTHKDIKKTIDLNDLFDHEKVFADLKNIPKPLKATLFANYKKLNCSELLDIKNFLKTLDIDLINIFSNSRATVLSAKSLKVNAYLNFYSNNESSLYREIGDTQEDLVHKGTIRSGNKISSNGNLIVLGDINPGAFISAKKNIYVWGKLLGVAYAGQDGDDNAAISSLYLNPLQLRINNVIAIGPKEKPIEKYPETAVIEEGSIIIKPLLIGN